MQTVPNDYLSEGSDFHQHCAYGRDSLAARELAKVLEPASGWVAVRTIRRTIDSLNLPMLGNLYTIRNAMAEAFAQAGWEIRLGRYDADVKARLPLLMVVTSALIFLQRDPDTQQKYALQRILRSNGYGGTITPDMWRAIKAAGLTPKYKQDWCIPELAQAVMVILAGEAA